MSALQTRLCMEHDYVEKINSSHVRMQSFFITKHLFEMSVLRYVKSRLPMILLHNKNAKQQKQNRRLTSERSKIGATFVSNSR